MDHHIVAIDFTGRRHIMPTQYHRPAQPDLSGEDRVPLMHHARLIGEDALGYKGRGIDDH